MAGRGHKKTKPNAAAVTMAEGFVHFTNCPRPKGLKPTVLEEQLEKSERFLQASMEWSASFPPLPNRLALTREQICEVLHCAPIGQLLAAVMTVKRELPWLKEMAEPLRGKKGRHPDVRRDLIVGAADLCLGGHASARDVALVARQVLPPGEHREDLDEEVRSWRRRVERRRAKSRRPARWPTGMRSAFEHSQGSDPESDAGPVEGEISAFVDLPNANHRSKLVR